MWHTDAQQIGPSVTIGGERYYWFHDTLMDGSFNKLAVIEEAFHVSTQTRRYTLILYSHKHGFRFIDKTQLLPMAESMVDAKRMAVPVIAFLLEN